MEFECRYVHDWAYNQALYKQTRWQNMGSILFWLLFAVFAAVMSVYTYYLDERVSLVVLLYVLFCLVALWQVFGSSLLVRRGWKKNCAKWGRDAFETVVTIGQSVHLLDDTGMEADIPWHRIVELERSGNFFILRGEAPSRNKRRKKRVDYLYFPRSGFADGTGDAFLKWLVQERPGVALVGIDRDKILKQQ